ncbi:flagellar hook assembly protein FlgD, partial [Enterobacter cloacae]
IEVGGIVKNVRIPLDGSATVLNVGGMGEIAYNNISQFGKTSTDEASKDKA